MTRNLVVLGAGGFGRETLDVVEAINARTEPAPFRLLGVLDDAPSDINLRRLAERGVAHLGRIDAWLGESEANTAYAVAIGQPGVRRYVVARLDAAQLEAATLVHPDAQVGTRVAIAAGTIVCGGVQVSTNVALGRHVHVNPNATLGHDAVLEDFVSVNPAATISGECTIGSGSLIGASAVVLQGLHVGAGSVVGAAACVTRHVAAGDSVRGVPARVAQPDDHQEGAR